LLLAVIEDFQLIWYVEPEVLLSGDAEAIVRIKQRALELGVPWRKCALRKRQGGRGAPPVVIVPELY
jgi:hypothetical protein